MNSPSAPDPYTTAAAQTQSNNQTAQTQQELNMVNQSNPYGSLTYSQSGTNPDGTPIYNATTTLSPAQQQLLEQSEANQSAAGKVANQYVTGGQGAFSGSGPDLSWNGTATALQNLTNAQLDPQWTQNSNVEEAKLAAQGLSPGQEGYDSQMNLFNQAKNNAYQQADLGDYQQVVNNAQTQWQDPLTAYSSLMGLSQPTGFTPMNTPTTNVAGTNVSGLVEQNYQQESQNANAQNGQLAGLAGTALGAAFGVPALGGALGGSMGGLFGSSPSMGGGNLLSGDAYGGSATNPLPGLTYADYA
jgi:hypothetical protein